MRFTFSLHPIGVNKIIRAMSIPKFLLIVAVFAVSACATNRSASAQGTGMTIAYSNTIPGKKIDVKNIVTDGPAIPNPGPLGPSQDPQQGRSVMGAAPDGRSLPEWAEFQWKEWPYPGEKYPSDFAARQIWNAKVDELSRTLPVNSERVRVRDRIPADVFQRLAEARRHPVAGQDLRLWLSFVWYAGGIRFHWELKEGCCDLKQAGGDVID
jgi:hypothetical protein